MHRSRLQLMRKGGGGEGLARKAHMLLKKVTACMQVTWGAGFQHDGDALPQWMCTKTSVGTWVHTEEGTRKHNDGEACACTRVHVCARCW